jgi:hypothetical protein
MKKHIAPKHLRAATRRWWEAVVEEYDLESTTSDS